MGIPKLCACSGLVVWRKMSPVVNICFVQCLIGGLRERNVLP